MNDRRALNDLRINVLPAEEVSVWHCMLRLALELDRAGAPMHSTRRGRFDYRAADGRIAYFTADLMAQVFELPAPLVASAIAKLLELKIVGSDDDVLFIEEPEDWFVPLTESPPLQN